MLLQNVDNQKPTIDKLNERINKTVKQSNQGSSPLLAKLEEMNETYELVHCLGRQKKNGLLDCLREVSLTPKFLS